MPKMTRAAFTAEADTIWTKAQENFARDSHLTGVLIGYDTQMRQTMFMQVHEEALGDQADMNMLRQMGAFPVPGHWQDHAGAIGTVLRKHKVVATLHVGEAWVVLDQDAGDALARGIPASEHPNRVEIAFMSALWPREFYAEVRCREIVTGADGTKTLQPLDLPSDGTEQGGQIASWLAALLPQPPGRTAPASISLN